MKEDGAITVNILMKKEGPLWIAHCLELDIVATGETEEMARKDMVALICAQIDYAFSHDNLDNLFHPAPQEVWEEFFTCWEKLAEERYRVEPGFHVAPERPSVPPWIIAKTYHSKTNCHA